MNARVVRAVLAYASLAAVLGALLLVLRVPIPDPARDVVMVIIGALIAQSKEAFSFFFGTSQSSHDKTEAMAALADTTPRPVEVVNDVANPVPVVPDTPLDLAGAELPEVRP